MSNVLLMDGFDMYNGIGANTGLQSKWVLAGNSPSLVTGRFGGQAVQNAFGGGNTGGQTVGIPGAALSQCAFGCAFQLLGAAGGQQTLGEWTLRLGSTYICGVRPNPNGGLDAYRLTTDPYTGVLLGSSANNIVTANQWNYLEVEVVLSATVGRITVYLNSTQVINLTAQNISNGAAVTVDTFSMQHYGSGFTIQYDDFYLVDTAAKLGECKIETLRPNADNTKVFTPDTGTANFSRVNETLVDGDTSYVQAAAVGNRDLYAIASLGSNPASVFAVNVVSFARKTDATARTLANSVHSGATDSDGSPLTLLPGYGRLDRIMQTDPNTSAAWTGNAVNALLIGPKVAS